MTDFNVGDIVKLKKNDGRAGYITKKQKMYPAIYVYLIHWFKENYATVTSESDITKVDINGN